MTKDFYGRKNPADEFADKTVLITGGTGTVGLACLKRLLSYPVKEIRIFSRDESKQYDMQNTYSDKRISYFLGDLKDRESILYALSGSSIVFHTAALKQVPLCERNPLEAVKTNILGTDHLLSAADICNVEKLIYLSSDKAVDPTCTMGLTKKLEEIMCVSKSQYLSPLICGVRFGNVLFSKGSVIPLFIDQISRGRKITVTDPKMTRFIMSIDEAVDLVLYASLYGKSGQIYVKKCRTCRIGDLVEAISFVFSDIYTGSEIIGVRKNEKYHEVMLTAEETRHIVEENDDFIGIDYTVPPDPSKGREEYNSGTEKLLSVEELKSLLLESKFLKENLVQIIQFKQLNTKELVQTV